MKQLILTGLATEQRFGQKEGLFFLVFNDGELRVPISETAAEVVVKEMYSDQEESEPPYAERDEPEDTSNYDNVYDDSPDDVDQI